VTTFSSLNEYCLLALTWPGVVLPLAGGALVGDVASAAKVSLPFGLDGWAGVL
jgi:hypothetical protein